MNNSKATGKKSILIGENLQTDKDYHLLIDRNGIKVDKIMTNDEYELIMKIIKATGLTEQSLIERIMSKQKENSEKKCCSNCLYKGMNGNKHWCDNDNSYKSGRIDHPLGTRCDLHLS